MQIDANKLINKQFVIQISILYKAIINKINEIFNCVCGTYPLPILTQTSLTKDKIVCDWRKRPKILAFPSNWNGWAQRNIICCFYIGINNNKKKNGRNKTRENKYSFDLVVRSIISKHLKILCMEFQSIWIDDSILRKQKFLLRWKMQHLIVIFWVGNDEQIVYFLNFVGDVFWLSDEPKMYFTCIYFL